MKLLLPIISNSSYSHFVIVVGSNAPTRHLILLHETVFLFALALTDSLPPYTRILSVINFLCLSHFDSQWKTCRGSSCHRPL